MKKGLLLALAALVLVAGAIVAGVMCLNSPQWWQKEILRLAPENKNVRIRDVVVDRVVTDFRNGSIHFSGVKLKIKINNNSYFCSIGNLSFHDIYKIIGHKGDPEIFVKNIALVSDALNISEMSFSTFLKLKDFKYQGIEGNFIIKQVDYNKVLILDIDGLVKADLNNIYLTHVKSTVLGGQHESTITIGLSGEHAIMVNESFMNINLSKLEDINPDLFHQVTGFADGQVQITISNGMLKAFRGRMIAEKGGELNAEFLKYIAPYVPQGSQIDALIKQGKPFPYTKARFESLSFNDRKYTSRLVVNSFPMNLNLNLDLDINVQEGLLLFIKNSVWGDLCYLFNACSL